MGWQPAGGPSGSAADAEVRCGTQRPSMETNVLIAKTPLGKVKKTTFNNSPTNKAYGTVMPPDAEGARAVISSWRGHVPNPDAVPGPDFMAMNAAAADGGLVSSGQFRTFRSTHPITLRTGVEGVAKPPPQLPSNKNPSFTYGLPAAHRSAEVVRGCGPEEPAMKSLVQGTFSNDWVRMNVARQAEFDAHRKYIKPKGTSATQGHALGALQTIAAAEASSKSRREWKMTRFENRATPRITQYMQGQQHAYDQQQEPQYETEEHLQQHDEA